MRIIGFLFQITFLIRLICFRINDLQSQERKSRQMLESQLNQERKLRKQADEKANIPRCSDNCKMKKMQLDNENNKLRREILLMEETKQNLEKHNRQLEHEVSRVRFTFLANLKFNFSVHLFSFGSTITS